MKRVNTLIGKLAIAFIMIAFVLTGCKYDTAEELYPTNKCKTSEMSYTNDILPILSNNGCIACHGNTATLDLTGYDDLKIHVDNGSVMGSIRQEDGYRAMPDNSPKIDECEIKKLEAWIADGALNN